MFKEEEAGAGGNVRDDPDPLPKIKKKKTSQSITDANPHPKSSIKQGGGGGEKQVFAELWSATALLKTFQLAHAHGPVMGDSWFGAFTWCAFVRTMAQTHHHHHPHHHP